MALLVWAKSVSPYKTPDPGIIKICTADCTVKFLLLVPGFPNNNFGLCHKKKIAGTFKKMSFIDASQRQYLCTTGYFKTQVILKQQFTIEKGYYVTEFHKEIL